jgi:hypothetical protein
MADDAEALHTIFAEIRNGMERRALSAADVSAVVGVSASYFESCLLGTRRLATTRLVLACREVGIDFRSIAATLDKILAQTAYLRLSRAARPYTCSYCASGIDQGDSYIRLEPFGPTRQSGAPILYFCRSCSALAKWMQPPKADEGDDRKLLPLAEHVKETRVQLIDISSTLSTRILAKPDELLLLSASQFEEFVLDRLSAMGLDVRQVGGGTYRRDGGIDIIFTPPKAYPFPFLGAVK